MICCNFCDTYNPLLHIHSQCFESVSEIGDVNDKNIILPFK